MYRVVVWFCFKATGFVFFVILSFINSAVARQDIKSKLCVILCFDSSLHRLCDIPPSVPPHAVSISDWIHKDALILSRPYSERQI